MSFSPTSPDPAASRPWQTATGLPTPYIARAALNAAATIDSAGAPISQARESYWHKATGGEYSAASLAVGEALLLDLGLLIKRDGRLHPTESLEELLDGSLDDALGAIALKTSCLAPSRPKPSDLEDLVPDPQRREELLLAHAQRFDDRRQRLIGEIGEELVLAAARKELMDLNRGDLARRVRRVSLESDALGYDISAPRLIGNSRLLEVKATTLDREALRIHISRNEVKTGKQFPDWSLVVCRVADVDSRAGELLGWCPIDGFRSRLPVDVEGGRWEQAEVEIHLGELMPNLPLATL